MIDRTDKLPPLALQVLGDHQRAPSTPFYDLFALGTFVDLRRLVVLDAAYEVLERQGFVERVDGGRVDVSGHVRPMFRLSSASARGAAA